MENRSWISRIIQYCAGLFVLSMGISFTIHSNLGVSPGSSLPYVISQITGLDLGTATTYFFIVIILSQFAILRKQFHLKSWLQIFVSVLFGWFLNICNFLTTWVTYGDSYLLQISFSLIGIVLVATGFVTYMDAEIMPLPAEGLMTVAKIKFGTPIHKGKMTFDCTSVILSVILSWIFLGKIVGVREGSALCAVGVGACIKVIQKRVDEFKSKKQKNTLEA